MTWTTAAEVEQALEDAIAAMFTQVNAEGQLARGDRLYALTPSYVGGCTKQAAYRAAGTPPSDPELAVSGEHRAALLGTWIHEGFLPALAAVLAKLGGPGPRVEHEITVRCNGLTLTGSTDLWDEWLRLLLDLKTLFIGGVENLVRTGNRPRFRHRLQVGTYALGRQQMSAIDGSPVPEWVAWPYMERTLGKTRVYAEPWTRDYALTVWGRLEEIIDAASDPDTARREARGPGLAAECDGCPWLRRCWGEDAVPEQPGVQAVLARDAAEVEAWCRLWLEQSRQLSELKSARELSEAVITGGGRRPGAYGRAEWWRRNGGEVLDQAAAVQLLSDLGIRVPKKSRKGPLHVTVRSSDS